MLVSFTPLIIGSAWSWFTTGTGATLFLTFSSCVVPHVGGPLHYLPADLTPHALAIYTNVAGCSALRCTNASNRISAHRTEIKEHEQLAGRRFAAAEDAVWFDLIRVGSAAVCFHCCYCCCWCYCYYYCWHWWEQQQQSFARQHSLLAQLEECSSWMLPSCTSIQDGQVSSMTMVWVVIQRCCSRNLTDINDDDSDNTTLTSNNINTLFHTINLPPPTALPQTLDAAGLLCRAVQSSPMGSRVDKTRNMCQSVLQCSIVTSVLLLLVFWVCTYVHTGVCGYGWW